LRLPDLLRDVDERRRQVEQAQAQLEQARLNLSYCEVRAPSDGWITKRNVQLGTLLQAGVSLFSIRHAHAGPGTHRPRERARCEVRHRAAYADTRSCRNTISSPSRQ